MGVAGAQRPDFFVEVLGSNSPTGTGFTHWAPPRLPISGLQPTRLCTFINHTRIAQSIWFPPSCHKEHWHRDGLKALTILPIFFKLFLSLHCCSTYKTMRWPCFYWAVHVCANGSMLHIQSNFFVYVVIHLLTIMQWFTLSGSGSSLQLDETIAWCTVISGVDVGFSNTFTITVSHSVPMVWLLYWLRCLCVTVFPQCYTQDSPGHQTL